MTPLTRQELDQALDRQNVQIESLFQARMETVRALVAKLDTDLADHRLADKEKFSELDKHVIDLRLSRSKLAGIATVAALLASGLTAFVVQVLVFVFKLK